MEGLKTIALSAFLAFGIRTFVAEARYIPSGSMLPTLEIDDRLIVDKVGYRFKSPQRGDIIVFSPTQKLEEQKYHDAFIKRVIGLPGERVEVRNNRAYINDRPLGENYTNDGNHTTKVSQQQDNWGPQVVPQDQYLVLGDNRKNSYDGRSWGFVPRDKIIGRAVVRFWPMNRVGEITPDPSYQK